MRGICFGTIAILAAGLLPELHAQHVKKEKDPRAKFAAVEPYEVDSDFDLQGEYFGSLDAGRLPQPYPSGHCHDVDRGGGQPWHRVGLQIFAKGDGQFEGYEYSGGLPGSGAYGPKIKLFGFRQGDAVLMRSASSDHSFVLENGTALAFYPGWEPMGQIARVIRTSPTLGIPPYWGSRVLFDGSSTKHFKDGKMTYDGLLNAGTELKYTYEDYTLHVEFQLPYMPYAREQGRANSGVYLQSRYEVQILDSFGLDGVDNEAGALYKYKAPDLNMVLPPLSWQTYDIDFRSPRFDQLGNKLESARVTVRLNGVIVQNNISLERKTGGGAEETPNLLPIKLQYHGNPVRFRNIWIVDRRESPTYAGPTIQSRNNAPLGEPYRQQIFGQQPYPQSPFQTEGYNYRYPN